MSYHNTDYITIPVKLFQPYPNFIFSLTEPNTCEKTCLVKLRKRTQNSFVLTGLIDPNCTRKPCLLRSEWNVSRSGSAPSITVSSCCLHSSDSQVNLLHSDLQQVKPHSFLPSLSLSPCNLTSGASFPLNSRVYVCISCLDRCVFCFFSVFYRFNSSSLQPARVPLPSTIIVRLISR